MDRVNGLRGHERAFLCVRRHQIAFAQRHCLNDCYRPGAVCQSEWRQNGTIMKPTETQKQLQELKYKPNDLPVYILIEICFAVLLLILFAVFGR